MPVHPHHSAMSELGVQACEPRAVVIRFARGECAGELNGVAGTQGVNGREASGAPKTVVGEGDDGEGGSVLIRPV